MPGRGARYAAAQLKEQFYHGRPCARGHTLRYTKSAQCVTCRRAMFREKYKVPYNPTYQAYWRAKNPDKMRAIRQRHYAKAKTQEKAQARHREHMAKFAHTLQVLREDGYRL